MMLTNSRALEYILCREVGQCHICTVYVETLPHPEGGLEKADKPSRRRFNNI